MKEKRKEEGKKWKENKNRSKNKTNSPKEEIQIRKSCI